MGKTLFLCNSVYQLLFSLNLRMTVFKDDNVDFVISDQMNGSEKLVDGVNKYVDDSYAYHLKIKEVLNSKKGKIAYVSEVIKINKAIEKLNISINQYSVLGYANIDLITSNLYEKMADTCERCFIFEDGISTYSEDFFLQFLAEKRKRRYAKLTDELWLIRSIGNKSDYEKNGVHQMQAPVFDRENRPLLDTFNKVYEYDKNKDSYDRKVLFFEESYYSDLGSRDDEVVISNLEKKYGKENIMIKIHPRNRENRFERKGFKTNKNTSIPWELIVMNENVSDKILCTMMSAAVVTPWIMGLEPRVVLFYKCVDADLINSRFLPVIEKICEDNRDLFFVPDTYEDFLARRTYE